MIVALALVLAGGTDFRRFSEALKLVGMELDDKGQLQKSPDSEESTAAPRSPVTSRPISMRSPTTM